MEHQISLAESSPGDLRGVASCNTEELPEQFSPRWWAGSGATEEAAATFPTHLFISKDRPGTPAAAARPGAGRAGPSRPGDAAAPREEAPRCWGAKPPPSHSPS